MSVAFFPSKLQKMKVDSTNECVIIHKLDRIQTT